MFPVRKQETTGHVLHVFLAYGGLYEHVSTPLVVRVGPFSSSMGHVVCSCSGESGGHDASHMAHIPRVLEPRA